jgi:hypothetical protein
MSSLIAVARRLERHEHRPETRGLIVEIGRVGRRHGVGEALDARRHRLCARRRDDCAPQCERHRFDQLPVTAVLRFFLVIALRPEISAARNLTRNSFVPVGLQAREAV